MGAPIQWTDEEPETGRKRFVSAEKFARRWHFKVRFRRREDWDKHAPVTLAMWEALLEGLERRVQRSEGITHEDVDAVRKIIANWRDPPTI